jgi:MscS family membrane protein
MKKLIFALLTLLAIGANLHGQIKPDTIRIRLKTPRDAVMLHYYYTEEDSYYPKIAAKALNLDGIKRKKGPDLAVKLKKILHGYAIVPRFKDISTDPDYVDSATGRQVYYPFVSYKNIYLEKIRGNWKYSKETVGIIEEVYSELYPVDIYTYVNKLPAFFRFKLLFKMEIWQILSLFVLVLVFFVLSKIMRLIVRYFIKFTFAKLLHKEFVDKHFRAVVKTTANIISLSLVIMFVPLLELPISVHVVITLIYRVVLLLLFIALAFRLTDYTYDRLITYMKKRAQKVTLNLMPFFRTMFKTLLVIVGFLFIIVSLGFDIWPWLAGMSIGGLAVALAAQETIKNIFGSITILADRPFDVGDWIIYDNFEGTVEEIGIRSTTIRTFSDSVITVPNGKLMDVTINNMGLRHYRRFQTYLDVIYGTPVELLDGFVKGIEKLVQKHEFTRKDVHYIYLNNLASSSIQIFIRVWFTSKTWKDELRDRHIFISDILRLASALGIEFAFPTQSLYIEHFPGAQGNKQITAPTQEEIDKKIDEFFRSKGVASE